MARSIWSGSISFGLVNIPVKVVTAQRDKSVRFHLLHKKDGVRVKQQRICPKDGKEVPWDDVAKGYEVSRDQYVMITKEELEGLAPEKSRLIDIQDFVQQEEIDPAYFESPYYLVPDKNAAKPYALLLSAMTQADRVAIARMVMREKEYLVALRPKDKILTLETMRFADELVSPESAMEDVDLPVRKVDKREVELAKKLIDALTTPWDPEKYEDEYRQRVLDMVERKAEGKEIIVQPSAPSTKPAGDLLAALKASVQEAQRRIAAT